MIAHYFRDAVSGISHLSMLWLVFLKTQFINELHVVILSILLFKTLYAVYFSKFICCLFPGFFLSRRFCDSSPIISSSFPLVNTFFYFFLFFLPAPFFSLLLLHFPLPLPLLHYILYLPPSRRLSCSLIHSLRVKFFYFNSEKRFSVFFNGIL